MRAHPAVTIFFRKFGCVTAELYPEHAPETVRNFIRLIQRGYYDGLRIHQVIPGYMIAGGCPLGRGISGPGYGIYGEFPENGFDNPLRHTAGALTMLRRELPNTAGSIFAILCGDIPSMDGRQAVFGRVTEGLDVVEQISRVRRDRGNRPYFPPRIMRMEVDTFGEVYEKPQMLDLQRRIVTFR